LTHLAHGGKIFDEMQVVLEKSKSLLKAFLDLVLPPVCYVCGRACSGKYGLCEVCLASIKYIAPPRCPKCGRHLSGKPHLCPECTSRNTSVEKSWSCCHYEGVIKECVHLFKYKGYVGLVDIFKDVIVDFTRKNEIQKEVDLIVPVPVYPAKKRERPYNHAEILATSVSKSLAIPVDIKNLKKISWTRSQSELDRQRRLKNIKGSFLAVDRLVFSDKSILLVDDVYTTGATVNECAKALLETNAKKVISLTLARGA